MDESGQQIQAFSCCISNISHFSVQGLCSQVIVETVKSFLDHAEPHRSQKRYSRNINHYCILYSTLFYSTLLCSALLYSLLTDLWANFVEQECLSARLVRNSNTSPFSKYSITKCSTSVFSRALLIKCLRYESYTGTFILLHSTKIFLICLENFTGFCCFEQNYFCLAMFTMQIQC